MPEGVFGHLTGPGNELGSALVPDPRIAAVGFTGSRSGGLALMRLAQAGQCRSRLCRDVEHQSGAAHAVRTGSARCRAGTAFINSLTMGAGQFCTNPGLLLGIEGQGLDAFAEAARSALEQTAGVPMLTDGIRATYEQGVEALAGHNRVETIARGRMGEGVSCGRAALFATSADAFLADEMLGHEVFGASSLLVRCRDEGDLVRVLDAAKGQLTATIHLDEGDVDLARQLMPILEMNAGRILANGWPTGVEVTHAMVHGGPFPATSDGRTTSVGSLAINRFLRPVSYQNLPSTLLPPELRDNEVSRFPPCWTANRGRGRLVGAGHPHATMNSAQVPGLTYGTVAKSSLSCRRGSASTRVKASKIMVRRSGNV